MSRIKPQDKTPVVPVTFKFRVDLERKLSAYAKFLDDSSPSYVAAAIIDSALESDKDFQRFLSNNPGALSAAAPKLARRGRPSKLHSLPA
jgi:hypothetical protein